jgi:phage replication O-like protein O
MPSPQLEEGFLQIAREIAEALCRINLSPYESRVLWFVFLKTYGFKKKTDWIALSQFAKGLLLDRRNIHRALKSLSFRHMIVIGRDDKKKPTYSFQKDYSKWKLSSLETPTKETLTKYINTTHTPAKDENFENFILVFWSIYPKRAGSNSKKAPFKAWKARIRAGTKSGEMLAGLYRYADYIKATGKEGTEFVKQGATFFGPDEHWNEPWDIPAVEKSNGFDGGFVG